MCWFYSLMNIFQIIAVVVEVLLSTWCSVRHGGYDLLASNIGQKYPHVGIYWICEHDKEVGVPRLPSSSMHHGHCHLPSTSYQSNAKISPHVLSSLSDAVYPAVWRDISTTDVACYHIKRSGGERTRWWQQTRHELGRGGGLREE